MNVRKRHDTTRSDTGQTTGATPTNRRSSTGNSEPGDGSLSAQLVDNADRLEGWKEIAAFVERDVRSAQRWKEQGLPVRRLPGEKRGRVYAFKAEISEWLQGHSEPDQPPPTAPPIPQPTFAKGWLLPMVVGVAVVVTAVTGHAILSLFSRSLPAQIRFDESTATALDAQGRRLWTHRFPRRLDLSTMEPFGGPGEFVRVADLRGDGHRQVVLAAPYRLGTNPHGPLQFEVDCFSETGALLWSYVPRETFRFGDHEISGHWFIQALLVSDTSSHLIWMAFSDSEWGNSWAASVDTLTGRATVRFVNTGTIRSLNELRTSVTTYLLVGAFSNEYDGASLAVVDERSSFAASPQTAGTRHQCTNCPPGLPDYYFVFPRSEVNRQRQVYETPVGSLTADQGRLEVSPYELYPDFQTRSIYEFVSAPTIRPTSLRYSSTYESRHRDLEQTHQINHTLEKCPERLHPLPVKMWTPADGWTEIKIKPVD